MTLHKALTKDEYHDEASEQLAKKAKKAKTDKASEAIGSGSTIQEEVQDLKPVKVLNKRTRSGKELYLHNLNPVNPPFLKGKEN